MLIATTALSVHAHLWADSTVSVTTQSDVSVSGDGQCTIAEALGGSGGVQLSEVFPGGDCEPVVTGDAEPLVILLQADATYQRSEALSVSFGLFQSVEIDGQGATVVRDPSATGLFSLISVILGASETLTLRDLTLREGQAERSAGLEASGNNGSMRLERVRFIDNQALGNEIGQGTSGALGFGGDSIQIDDCLFDGNHADRFAGAVNLASVSGTITASRFVGNTSAGGAGALRIQNSRLRIVRTVFDGNTAAFAGGAIDMESNPELAIEQSTFTGNRTDGFPGQGGAMDISRSMRILGSLFTGNSASGPGGAIYKSFPLSGRVTVENSTFFENTAAGNGGGGFPGSRGH